MVYITKRLRFALIEEKVRLQSNDSIRCAEVTWVYRLQHTTVLVMGVVLKSEIDDFNLWNKDHSIVKLYVYA